MAGGSSSHTRFPIRLGTSLTNTSTPVSLLQLPSTPHFDVSSIASTWHTSSSVTITGPACAFKTHSTFPAPNDQIYLLFNDGDQCYYLERAVDCHSMAAVRPSTPVPDRSGLLDSDDSSDVHMDISPTLPSVPARAVTKRPAPPMEHPHSKKPDVLDSEYRIPKYAVKTFVSPLVDRASGPAPLRDSFRTPASPALPVSTEPPGFPPTITEPKRPATPTSSLSRPVSTEAPALPPAKPRKPATPTTSLTRPEQPASTTAKPKTPAPPISHLSRPVSKVRPFPPTNTNAGPRAPKSQSVPKTPGHFRPTEPKAIPDAPESLSHPLPKTAFVPVTESKPIQSAPKSLSRPVPKTPDVPPTGPRAMSPAPHSESEQNTPSVPSTGSKVTPPASLRRPTQDTCAFQPSGYKDRTATPASPERSVQETHALPPSSPLARPVPASVPPNEAKVAPALSTPLSAERSLSKTPVLPPSNSVLSASSLLATPETPAVPPTEPERDLNPAVPAHKPTREKRKKVLSLSTRLGLAASDEEEESSSGSSSGSN